MTVMQQQLYVIARVSWNGGPPRPVPFFFCGMRVLFHCLFLFWLCYCWLALRYLAVWMVLKLYCCTYNNEWYAQRFICALSSLRNVFTWSLGGCLTARKMYGVIELKELVVEWGNIPTSTKSVVVVVAINVIGLVKLTQWLCPAVFVWRRKLPQASHSGT